ncbi:MAG: AarF/UbiB family protein, partial [Verrucomicrobiota bacterium]
LPTGETVAVKVRQPPLPHRLTIACEWALWLAGKLQLYVPALRRLDLPGVVAEARDGVLRELDFRHEARHQRYFNSLNPNPTEVYAPKVHDTFSSESVLVMEWVDGTPVGQLRGDEPADQRRRWARRGVESLVRQVFLINLHHRGLEEHDDAVKIAANRITLGVIIGALIIGSSLIVTTGIQPHLFGYPALGIVGYLLSAVLGLYVVWDIIRHGRHR